LGAGGDVCCLSAMCIGLAFLWAFGRMARWLPLRTASGGMGLDSVLGEYGSGWAYVDLRFTD